MPEGTNMLLNSVMQSSQFFATSFFQRRSINYQLHMSTLDETWSVVTGLEAFNRFLIVVSRVG